MSSRRRKKGDRRQDKSFTQEEVDNLEFGKVRKRKHVQLLFFFVFSFIFKGRRGGEGMPD